MVRVSTLLDLLAVLVALIGTAPLWPYLDRAPQLILPAALLAGLIFDRWRKYPLSAFWATLLSFACVIGYAVQINLAHLVEPVINLLALLLAVRLITEKNGRNYLQIFVLSVFTLAGSTLLSLNIGFFVYLILQVVLVTVGLVLLSFYAVDPDLVLSRPQFKKVMGAALILPFASLVLMLLFFTILPRTQVPLWNFLNPGSTAAAGFSDQVSPGRFAAMAATKAVAFRVTGNPLAPEQLYWRTIVLNTMAGSAWVRREPPAGESLRPAGNRRLTLEFYCEPRQGRYLPTLDLPVQLNGVLHRDIGEGIFITRRRNERRLRYQVVSAPDGYFVQTGRSDRQFYLDVDTIPSARVAALARKIAAEGHSAAQRIALLEDFFRAQKLQYATTDLPGPKDPIDRFLFEKKRGYCEFFASSFAQLLRLSGVPARLVGGYYGGDYNELGGYYVVTEETAHVWVEALLDDGRWQRIDPSRLAENAAGELLGVRGGTLSLGRRLADAVDYFWNQAVITYDFNRQLDMARSLRDEWRNQRPEQVIGMLLLVLLVSSGLISGWKKLSRGSRSREIRILNEYLKLMKKRYGEINIPENIGLYELAKEAGDARCREFADIYGGALYRDRKLTAEELRRLREILRELNISDSAG